MRAGQSNEHAVLTSFTLYRKVKSVQANAGNRFRIASIGKTYTAVMIMQLVEEQKLKLTDILDRLFPQVPNTKKITIVQMLSHRSGIPNVQRGWGPQRNWRNEITKNEMFDLISKATPEFEPDTKQSYSNSDYFLLTLILEKITGKSYADALKDRITSKIEFADTYIEPGFIDVKAYQQEEKLGVAYTTNAKICAVEKIVRGAVEVYYHKPFQIPTFEAIAVSPGVLDKFGVYSSSDAPAKFAITRKDGRPFVQPGNESATALEATAPDRFQLAGGRIVFEFDAAKGQMILKRGGGERVFTNGK